MTRVDVSWARERPRRHGPFGTLPSRSLVLRFANALSYPYSMPFVALAAIGPMPNPWYPDLMIYHSYTAGNYLEYDAIMQLVRRRTTTEIMQQTHHVTVNGGASEDRESYAQIPSVANRLGYYVIDVSLTATGDSAPAIQFIQVHRPPLR